MQPIPSSLKHTYPKSQIRAKGSKPLRTPIEIRVQPNRDINSPVLNEMLAFEPHTAVPDKEYSSLEKKMKTEENQYYSRQRKLFFSSLVQATKLDVPPMPTIDGIESISAHHDGIQHFKDDDVQFAVRPLNDAFEINPEMEPGIMRLIQSSLSQ